MATPASFWAVWYRFSDSAVPSHTGRSLVIARHSHLSLCCGRIFLRASDQIVDKFQRNSFACPWEFWTTKWCFWSLTFLLIIRLYYNYICIFMGVKNRSTTSFREVKLSVPCRKILRHGKESSEQLFLYKFLLLRY
jgi:hypothetical protein